MRTVVLQADIGDAVVHASFWVCALFVPVISVFWPWWKHPYGKAVMSLEVLLAAAFLPPELGLLGITSGWLTWFELVVLGLIAPRTAWLGWQIWKIQREETVPRHQAAAATKKGRQ